MMNNAEERQCPIHHTLSVIGGRWKWAILFHISRSDVIRYGQLKNCLPPIAHKTLSEQLKELNNSGIIHRKQYNVMPPKVEYSLTEKGKKLIPIFDLMTQWGEEDLESHSEEEFKND